jgi:hypothetical protein
MFCPKLEEEINPSPPSFAENADWFGAIPFPLIPLIIIKSTIAFDIKGRLPPGKSIF